MGSWYLLYYKRGQFLRAKQHLERQGVECLNPVVTVEKIVQDKRTLVSEPLFPNYLFIYFNPERIHTTTISATRGVSHFVRFGGFPTIIPHTIINDLMTYSTEKIIHSNVPQPGDTVLIVEGMFKGLQAIYNEPDGEVRSILLLKMISKEVSLSLNNRQFQKI